MSTVPDPPPPGEPPTEPAATPTVGPMIAARKASAAAKEQAVHEAIATLTRRRRPITFAAVAAAAGVSRGYLSRHPTHGPHIRSHASTPRLSPAPDSEQITTVEAALRGDIRALQARHAAELKELRGRVKVAEDENAHLRRHLLTATQPR